MKKIGFIGIGKLGLPCAEVIAENGYYVEGYDLNKKSSDSIKIVNSIEAVVKDKDIVFIAIPTPHKPEYDGSHPTSHLSPKDFDYSIVINCLKEANNYMNKSQVLVLISTVLPGTTREYFINLIDNTKFIYNPYLIAMGSVKWDMVNPEMILIGTKDGNENGDAVELIKFYKTIIKNNPRYIICTWDECECIKIFYNTFVSTKIVLVNMIQDVANKIGNIDVDIVTKALADSKMRIMGPQYMTAGMGDGGACHPRDNIALRHMAKKLDLGYDLFSAIMQSREVQAENLAKFLIKVSNENNLEIYIHGKSYKPGVPYCDGSYSILVADFIQKNGLNVKFIDPLTEQHTPKDIKGVVLLAHSPSTTYKYMAHESDSNDKFYCNILEGSIVVDPWRKFYTEKFKVIHYGNSRENNNSN